MQQPTNTNNKQLDSYSVLIISKYLNTEQDFINIICVNSKFKETTEKLRYNPIPITSLKLFPKIQTQYLYKKTDVKIKKETDKEICNMLFIKNVVLSNGLTKLSAECFSCCTLLSSIKIPSSIRLIENSCFYCCACLKTIDIPNTVTSIGKNCFRSCTSLQSFTLPSSLVSLENNTFSNCVSLTKIELPPTLTSIKDDCFSKCSQLKQVDGVQKMKIGLGNEYFINCVQLKDK
ncbi:hypothetical protein QTN25_010432 [Entamoeba marina]